MSEEQGTFKVTDRRLFNADGTPRDLPPEEKVEATPPPTPEAPPAATPEAPPAPAPEAPPVAETQAQTDAPTVTEANTAPLSEEELPGSEDPASFLNFLMSIASNAASAVGLMEHPVTHQRDVDLELGRHWIDVLAMLQEKTRGNLTPQESQILEGLLSDLRMQYVSLVNSATAKAPRGFTGRDITGGK